MMLHLIYTLHVKLNNQGEASCFPSLTSLELTHLINGVYFIHTHLFIFDLLHVFHACLAKNMPNTRDVLIFIPVNGNPMLSVISTSTPPL